MDFNRFIFPAPKASYCPSDLEKILWIPRNRFFSMKALTKSNHKFEDLYTKSKETPKNSNSPPKVSQDSIPCNYQSCGQDHKDVIIYFHGNAEDIGYASEFTKRLSIELRADVISVEYPGYGIYKGTPDAKTIIEDAEIVFDFLTAEMGVNPKNIVVFGRSIGSGPATHLAANRNPGVCILMSPYTSIRGVVKNIAGTMISSIFAERFTNIQEISKANCPCYFIHGKKDKIIPWEHSKELFETCNTYCGLHAPDNMSHNKFKLFGDVINPVKQFLNEINIQRQEKRFVFPEYVEKNPYEEEMYAARERITSKLFEVFITEP